MSVMIRSHSCDVLDDIFIFYDFQQVQDAMMIVAYFDNSNSWEKLFIYYSDDKWETKFLKHYFTIDKYDWICKQIDIILQHRENSTHFEGIYIDQNIPVDINFILGLKR